MDLKRAVEDVLLGASMRQVALVYRQELIDEFGFRPEEVTPETFARETSTFMRKVARHLGEAHKGDRRVQQALLDWVALVDHYEAWDALLAGFHFPGKNALVERGRRLFPGPLTSHWEDGP